MLVIFVPQRSVQLLGSVIFVSQQMKCQNRGNCTPLPLKTPTLELNFLKNKRAQIFLPSHSLHVKLSNISEVLKVEWDNNRLPAASPASPLQEAGTAARHGQHKAEGCCPSIGCCVSQGSRQACQYTIHSLLSRTAHCKNIKHYFRTHLKTPHCHTCSSLSSSD